MKPVLHAVKFAGHEKLYGAFASIEKARWWARAECDGVSFTIHRLDTPTP